MQSGCNNLPSRRTAALQPPPRKPLTWYLRLQLESHPRDGFSIRPASLQPYAFMNRDRLRLSGGGGMGSPRKKTAAGVAGNCRELQDIRRNYTFLARK